MVHHKTMQSSRRDGDLAGPLLYITCILTVLSQIPTFSLGSLYPVFWFALLLYAFVRSRLELRLSGFPLFFLLIILIVGCICSAFMLISGSMGYLTGFFLMLAKVALVYFTGWTLSCSVKAWNLKRFLYLYVIASTIFACWVYLTYIPSFSSWMSSQLYLFGSKNSFGQIAMVAALVALFLASGERGWRKAGVLSAAVLLVLVATLAQCRTTLLALIFSGVVYALMKKRFVPLIAVGAVVALVLAFVPEFQSFVAHAFLLDKYEGADLNTLSSGRIDMWAEALNVFFSSPLRGVGDYYVDNLYINLLASLGIIGATPFICVLVVRFALNVKRGTSAKTARSLGQTKDFRLLLLVLSSFYFFVSLLEGLPPFGPGACSFVFWFLCGIGDASPRE